VAIGRRRCAACGEAFRPRSHVLDQMYCSALACQRARWRRWQRAKRQSDADYRESQAQRAGSGPSRPLASSIGARSSTARATALRRDAGGGRRGLQRWTHYQDHTGKRRRFAKRRREVLQGGERLVLIDGYRRIDAPRRLGRDTARMWPRPCSASWRGIKAVHGGDRRSAAGS
jgi:hypothetical protein